MQNLKEVNTSLISRIAKTTDATLVESYEQTVEENTLKIKELKNKTVFPNIHQENFQTILEEVLEYIKNPLFQWQKPNYEDKRLFLNIFFEQKIKYYRNEGFQTSDLPLILALSTQQNVSKNSMVESIGTNGKL